jgi:hypothetical protein
MRTFSLTVRWGKTAEIWNVEAVGLSDFADIPAVELSYGRKRALEIATTLALVEEQHLGLQRQRGGDLERALATVGKLHRRDVGEMENVRIALQRRKRGDSFDFWRSETVLRALNQEAQQLVEA